jgi:hypothetical protein
MPKWFRWSKSPAAFHPEDSDGEPGVGKLNATGMDEWPVQSFSRRFQDAHGCA